MAKEESKKSEVLPSARVEICDAPFEDRDFALHEARTQVRKLRNGEVRDQFQVAEALAVAMKEKTSGTWHCIVGESFGSFVTSAEHAMIYMFVGSLAILLFRHG